MQAYWITFDNQNGDALLPYGLGLGCGLTACDATDALRVLDRHLFQQLDLSPVPVKAIDTVDDVSRLDEKHVIPNMGNIFMRGVWYPNIPPPVDAI